MADGVNDILLEKLIDALVEARASTQIALEVANSARSMAEEALTKLRAMELSTHKVTYVNSDQLGQINKEMSELEPDMEPSLSPVSFDLGKRLSEQSENDFEEDFDDTSE